MPAGNGTTPSSTLAGSCPSGADVDDLAEPHDSAYSADTSHRGQLQHPYGQPHAEAGHSRHITEQQQQRRLQSQEQSQQLVHQQQLQQQQLPQQHVEDEGPQGAEGMGVQQVQSGPLHECEQQSPGPGYYTSSGAAASHLQQARHQQPVESAITGLASVGLEPLEQTAPQAPEGEQLSQRQQQQQWQGQGQAQQWHQPQHRHLAHSYRSYAGWHTRHLQKRPSRQGSFLPAASSPSAVLAPHSEDNGSLPHHRPDLHYSGHSSQHVLAPAQSQADSATMQTKVGESSGREMSTQEQQLDTLHQQLQGLLEASSSINAALLQVQQQLQAYQSK